MANFLIIITSKYFFLISVLTLVVFLVKAGGQTRKRLMVLTLVAFILSFLLAKIAAILVYNPRPFVTEHIQPLFAHAADNGFPSDHTLLTATIASVIFVFNRRWGVLLFILSLLIGLARVLAYVHQPLDIVGSVLIAVSMTWVAFGLSKRLWIWQN